MASAYSPFQYSFRASPSVVVVGLGLALVDLRCSLIQPFDAGKHGLEKRPSIRRAPS